MARLDRIGIKITFGRRRNCPSPSSSGSTRGSVSARGTVGIEAVPVSADPRVKPEDDGKGRIVSWSRFILMPMRLDRDISIIILFSAMARSGRATAATGSTLVPAPAGRSSAPGSDDTGSRQFGHRPASHQQKYSTAPGPTDPVPTYRRARVSVYPGICSPSRSGCPRYWTHMNCTVPCSLPSNPGRVNASESQPDERFVGWRVIGRFRDVRRHGTLDQDGPRSVHVCS